MTNAERLPTWIPVQYKAEIRYKNGKTGTAAPLERVPMSLRRLAASEAPTAFIERGAVGEGRFERDVVWREIDGVLYRQMTSSGGLPCQTIEDATDDSVIQYAHDLTRYPFLAPGGLNVSDLRTTTQLAHNNIKVVSSDREEAARRAQADPDALVLVDDIPFARVAGYVLPSTAPVMRRPVNMPTEPVWTVTADERRDGGIIVGLRFDLGVHSGPLACFRADRKDEAIAYAHRIAEGREVVVDQAAAVEIFRAPAFDETRFAILQAWESVLDVMRHASVAELGLDGISAITRSYEALQGTFNGSGLDEAVAALGEVRHILEVRPNLATPQSARGPLEDLALRLAPDPAATHEDEDALSMG